ncbi:MAG: hypothetical protein OXC01_09145 [Immundisolibacterales bacterium]|nr:hypothetical protein [Immundisolibacterales bacterium]
MAIILSRTYEAFRAAGAPDDKARDAAEEIAAYDNRLANIEADVRLLKWMMGLVLAGVLSLVVKTFFT